MRLIHTGDIHIGSALALLPQEKAKLRQTEILDGFRRLSVFARENAVAAVLIAGDLLDTNKTPRYIKKEVFPRGKHLFVLWVIYFLWVSVI